MRRVLATCGMAAAALLSSALPAHAGREGSADVGVTVSGAPRTARAGDLIRYVVRLRNDGPSPAADVSAAVRLSAGLAIVSVRGADCDELGALVSCGPMRLPTGQARSIQIGAIVKPAAAGSVRVTARADSPTPDPDPGDNAASQVTPVGPSTDLAVRLAAPRAARPGGRLALAATVVNHGPRAADRVTLHLGIRRSTFTGAGGASCRVTGRRANGQFIRCDLGRLASGAQRTVRVTMQVDSRARARKATGEFAASTSSSMGDSRPANNVAVTRVRYAAC